MNAECLSAQCESLPQNSLLLSPLHMSAQVQSTFIIPVSSRWGGNDSEKVWKAGNGQFPCICKEEKVNTVLSVSAWLKGRTHCP